MFYNKEILEEFVVTKNRVNRIHRKMYKSIVLFLSTKVNLKVQPSTELQRTT